MRTGLTILTLCALFAFLFCLQYAEYGAKAGNVRRPDIPQVFLWAWQRSENLTSIDTKEFGIAYLVCDVLLSGTSERMHWRDQPLKVPPDTRMIPVIRIDTSRAIEPELNSQQLSDLCGVIERSAHMPRTCGVQIDFDAKQTEKGFYQELLKAAHQRMPADVPLSITALASWCLFDDWIRNLPVEETVPMMFSLGNERAKVLLYLNSNQDFRVPSCCHSLGISLEDKEIDSIMIPLVRRRKIPVRIYVYTKTAWTQAKLEALQQLLKTQKSTGRR